MIREQEKEVIMKWVKEMRLTLEPKKRGPKEQEPITKAGKENYQAAKDIVYQKRGYRIIID